VQTRQIPAKSCKIRNPDATRLKRKQGINFMAFDFDPRALPELATIAKLFRRRPLCRALTWLTSLPWLMRAENVQPSRDERPTIGRRIGARPGMYAPPLAAAAPPPMPKVEFDPSKIPASIPPFGPNQPSGKMMCRFRRCHPYLLCRRFLRLPLFGLCGQRCQVFFARVLVAAQSAGHKAFFRNLCNRRERLCQIAPSETRALL
jgi:hypothetical protein